MEVLVLNDAVSAILVSVKFLFSRFKINRISSDSTKDKRFHFWAQVLLFSFETWLNISMHANYICFWPTMN